jgi:transcriptional regulator with XRE-family HTH domain
MVPRKPQSVRLSGYARRVNSVALKKLLAGNLDRLLDADAERRGDRLTHGELAAKAGVGQGTIGRLARGEVAPAVDTLEAVAGVFSLQAWQMLIEGLDPAAPPEILLPALRDELYELRAMRVTLEGLLKDGQQGEGGDDGRDSSDRAASGTDISEQQKGGRRQRAADD